MRSGLALNRDSVGANLVPELRAGTTPLVADREQVVGLGFQAQSEARAESSMKKVSNRPVVQGSALARRCVS